MAQLVGKPMHIRANITGGLGPYKITWETNTVTYTLGPIFTHTFNGPNTVKEIRFSLIDANNFTLQTVISINVFPAPLRTSLYVQNHIALPNIRNEFVIHSDLPILPVKYTLYIDNKIEYSLQVDNYSFLNINYTFAHAGTFDVSVKAVDFAGYSAWNNTSIVVLQPIVYFPFLNFTIFSILFYFLFAIMVGISSVIYIKNLSLPICTTTIQWKSSPGVPSALLLTQQQNVIRLCIRLPLCLI